LIDNFSAAHEVLDHGDRRKSYEEEAFPSPFMVRDLEELVLVPTESSRHGCAIIT